MRRTRDKFRTELPSLLDSAYASAGKTAAAASSTSPSSTTSPQPATEAADDASIYSPTKTAPKDKDADLTTLTPESRLREWYAESLSDLAVMARAAIVNQMYEAPRLVVEGVGRVMTSGGGGAGAEAR